MKPELEFFAAASIPLTPCDGVVTGLNERILASDDSDGVATRILRFDPDIDTSANGTQSHTFWEEVYILAGEITDLRLGRTFRAGDYACRPPGMDHGPWRAGREGCLTFEVRYVTRDQH